MDDSRLTQRTAPAIEARIASVLTDWLHLAPGEIQPEAPLDTYALDSVSALRLVGMLEEELHVAIDPAIFFSEPNLRSFARHIARLCEQS